MAKFDWKSFVATVAPSLATALGGPLAGLAVQAIAKGLLPDQAGAGEKEIETALASATPADLITLKKIDAEFSEQMKALDIDLAKAYLADVQSARSLFSINYWPQIALSAVYIVGYFTILGLYLGGILQVPKDDQATANVLIGVLTTSIPMIMQFWFGSSFGSREKSQMLALSSPPATT